MGAHKKVTEAMWKTVDWELPVKEIATFLRCSIHLVYARARNTGCRSKVRKRHVFGVDWSAVDWSEKNNRVIAEKYNVTRERVRQVRPLYDPDFQNTTVQKEGE